MGCDPVRRSSEAGVDCSFRAGALGSLDVGGLCAGGGTFWFRHWDFVRSGRVATNKGSCLVFPSGRMVAGCHVRVRAGRSSIAVSWREFLKPKGIHPRACGSSRHTSIFLCTTPPSLARLTHSLLADSEHVVESGHTSPNLSPCQPRVAQPGQDSGNFGPHWPTNGGPMQGNCANRLSGGVFECFRCSFCWCGPMWPACCLNHAASYVSPLLASSVESNHEFGRV